MGRAQLQLIMHAPVHEPPFGQPALSVHSEWRTPPVHPAHADGCTLSVYTPSGTLLQLVVTTMLQRPSKPSHNIGFPPLASHPVYQCTEGKFLHGVSAPCRLSPHLHWMVSICAPLLCCACRCLVVTLQVLLRRQMRGLSSKRVTRWQPSHLASTTRHKMVGPIRPA